MRFGFFDQLPCAAGWTEKQRYEDFMAQIELGDQLGFSRAQAREESATGMMRFFREAGERLRPFGQADIKSYEAFQQVLARMEKVTFDDIDREVGVFGDPDYCIERIRQLRQAYNMDEFICHFNQGGLMAPALVRQSMTRFAHEVMPHCA